METIKNGPRQSQAGRRPLVTILTIASIAALLFVGFVLGRSTASKPAPAPAPKAVAAQDCTKPGTKVGALCASVAQEHGVTVTRTYVTQQYDSAYSADYGHPVKKFYNYLRDTSVQLNYGESATIDNLCRAGAVATTNPDHTYAYEYETMKKEYCDPAQKAKDAGDSDTCFMTLNDAYGLAPLAFTMANIDDACAQPVQPKGKSALVDTGALRNDVLWYDPSASPSNN